MRTKEMEHGRRQLRRLEMLTDVVFAIAIWRVFMLLPRPGDGDRSFSSILEMYRGDAAVLAIVLVGFVLMIVHWIQNNAVFGTLERTDNRHTVLSILQVCSLLLFLCSPCASEWSSTAPSARWSSKASRRRSWAAWA